MSFPYDVLNPMIRQMQEADGDRARMLILLSVPDLVLIKHREQFEKACDRAGFDLGRRLIDWRRASWSKVRGADGALPQDFQDAIAAFAAWAAGEAV